MDNNILMALCVAGYLFIGIVVTYYTLKRIAGDEWPYLSHEAALYGYGFALLWPLVLLLLIIDRFRR